MRKIFFILIMLVAGVAQMLAQSRYYSHIEPLQQLDCYIPFTKPPYTGDTAVSCKGNQFDYQLYVDSPDSCGWSVAGGTIISYGARGDSSSVRVQWGDVDQGILSATAIDENGDTCLAELTVVLLDRPQVRCQSSPSYVVDLSTGEKVIYVCEGNPVYFTDFSQTNGSEMLYCFWQCDRQSSTDNTFTFSPHGTGEYYVLHRVTNECGCYDEEKIKIIVKEECPLDISCYGTVCAHTPVTYQVSHPICTEYNWMIDGGIILETLGDKVSVMWNNTESGYGTLTLDGSSCNCPCSYNKSIRIPVISDQTTITGPDTVCLGTAHVFSVPMWGGTQYTWTSSGDTSMLISGNSDYNEVGVYFGQLGIHTLGLTYECATLDCGPYQTTKTIVVLDSIRIQSNSSDAICPNDTAKYWSSAAQGESLSWRVYHNDALVMQTEGDTCTCIFSVDGIYTVELHGDNYCNVARRQLTVLPRPRTPLLQEQYACPHSAIFLEDRNVPTNCYAVWTALDSSATPRQALGDKVSFTFDSTMGDFEVYYVDMQHGCRSLPGIQKVSKPRLAPSNLPSTIYMCQGQTIELSVPDQSDQRVLYHWAADSSHHVTVIGSELLPVVTIEATYNVRDELPYTRYLTLTRSYCDTSVSETIAVIIGQQHTPSIQPSDTSVCPGATVTFNLDPASAGTADLSLCYWRDGQNTTQYFTGASFTHTFERTSTVSFYYFSSLGCITGTASASVNVIDPPNVNIESDGINVSVSPTSQNYSYYWHHNGATASTTTYNAQGDNCCTVTDNTTHCSKVACYHPAAEGCLLGTLTNTPSTNCNCVTIPFQSTIHNGAVRISQGGWDTVCAIHNQDDFYYCAHTPGAYTFTVTSYDSEPCFYQDVEETIHIVPKVSVKTTCDGNLEITNRTQFYPIGDTVAGYIRIFHEPEMTEITDSALVLSASRTIEYSGARLTESEHYSIQLVIDNCTYSIEYTHRLPHIPTFVDTTMPSKCCANTPYWFSASSNEDVRYSWNFGDNVEEFGESVYHSFAPIEIPSGNADPDANTRMVTLTIRGAEGCDVVITNSVHIGIEEVSFSGKTIGVSCPGEPIRIELLDGNHNIGEYCWPELDDCIAANRIYPNTYCTVNNAGNYTVLALSEEYHCRQERIVSATNSNIPPAKIFSKDTFCFGEPVLALGFCGDDYDYQWELCDSQGTSIESSSIGNPTFSVQTSGKYTLKLTVTGHNSACSNTDEKTIIILAQEATPSIGFVGSPCIHLGPVTVSETSGRSLYWNNGEYGQRATYYRPGEVSAYYFNPVSQCKSQEATLTIACPPNMEAFLSGCYELCYPVRIHIPSLSADNSGNSCDVLRDGRVYLPHLQLPATVSLSSSGDYQIQASYGSGCGPVISESLDLTVQDCPPPLPDCLIIDSKVEGPVYEQCKILYYVHINIVNKCDKEVVLEDINFSPNLSYYTQTTFPLTIPQGGNTHILLKVEYDVMPQEGAWLRVFASGLGVVYQEVFTFSDWAAYINDCGLKFQTLSGAHEPNLGVLHQSEYYKFRIGLPHSIGSCLAIWMSDGTVINESWSSPYDVSLLTWFDYGRLTQMVYYGECIHIYALVCHKDQLCLIDTCINAQNLVDAAEWDSPEEFPLKHSGYLTQNALNSEAAPYLAPNPGTGMIQVISPNAISSIEVISIIGKKMLRAVNATTFEASTLPTGTYIVAVVDAANEVHYLKFIKK